MHQSLTVPGLSLLSARLMVPAASGEMDRDTDEVTWSITPQFALSDDVNLFATVSHGFKSGGFNVGWGPTPVASQASASSTTRTSCTTRPA